MVKNRNLCNQGGRNLTKKCTNEKQGDVFFITEYFLMDCVCGFGVNFTKLCTVISFSSSAINSGLKLCALCEETASISGINQGTYILGSALFCFSKSKQNSLIIGGLG